MDAISVEKAILFIIEKNRQISILMPQYLIERINTYCQLIIITYLDYVLLQMNSLANIKSVLIVVIELVFVAILLHKIAYVSNIPFNSIPIPPSN